MFSYLLWLTKVMADGPGPGLDGTPIWAPINLPPKTRPYKGFDILGNK